MQNSPGYTGSVNNSSVENNSGGTLKNNSSVENNSAGTLENNSSVEINSDGTLENNSSVENNSGGTLENNSGGTLENQRLVLIRQRLQYTVHCQHYHVDCTLPNIAQFDAEYSTV